ncbi:MAG TPA: nuclear transport factor 2 family protein [Alphaproteobacteria bacterium]|nr:nuclear transport factor 2 family protein [Alphaproteobacteria bacterium]
MTTTSPADEWALLQLAYRYAEAVDRRDADLLTSVFTADGTIERPGSVWQGHEKLRGIIARLNTLYDTTFHTVRNQTVEVDGDTAVGETYCVAMHMLPPNGGPRKRMDMGIRYQDRFVRQNGTWFFTRRHLMVDWIENTDLPEA